MGDARMSSKNGINPMKGGKQRELISVVFDMVMLGGLVEKKPMVEK